mmetsp:Transcript_30918/g.49619  ORF Transcript_30918/g.49619 Transcript_30918/m.49619 type:complete len:316 (-) Transcript_30918:208-1155(-)
MVIIRIIRCISNIHGDRGQHEIFTAVLFGGTHFKTKHACIVIDLSANLLHQIEQLHGSARFKHIVRHIESVDDGVSIGYDFQIRGPFVLKIRQQVLHRLLSAIAFVEWLNDIPQRILPLLIALLVDRSGTGRHRLTHGQQRQRQIHVATAIIFNLLLLALNELIKLQRDESRHQSRRGRDGRDDFACYLLDVVLRLLLNPIVSRAQIRRARNEVHMEIAVVVLLKLDRAQRHSDELFPVLSLERFAQFLNLIVVHLHALLLLFFLFVVGRNLFVWIHLKLLHRTLLQQRRNLLRLRTALQTIDKRPQIGGRGDIR